MISALNSAASGMNAQQAQIESIANNLANIQTTGYKKSRVEFQDLLYETLQEPGAKTSAQTQSPVGIQRGLGVKISGIQRNFEMGPPQHTKRSLDLFIKGDGFFVIQLPNGDTAYTRDGSLHKSATGRIETIDGYALQPDMNLPSNANSIEISEDGIAYANLGGGQRQQLGQIQLARFVNNGGLKAMGQNLFFGELCERTPEFCDSRRGKERRFIAGLLGGFQRESD